MRNTNNARSFEGSTFVDFNLDREIAVQFDYSNLAAEWQPGMAAVNSLLPNISLLRFFYREISPRGGARLKHVQIFLPNGS